MYSITVAIPVYNVEKYVRKSVISAINQDFLYPYEILIIDDCGNDKSMDIVRELINDCSRDVLIRVIKHKQNYGLGEARNTAIDNAQGKYIYFLDSDDWMENNCLACLYEIAESTRTDIAVGSVTVYDEKSNMLSSRVKYQDLLIEHDHAGVYLNIKDIPMHIEVWNKLIRLDFLRLNKIRTVHRIIEDSIFDFNMRIYAKRIAFTSNYTMTYNVREGSILTSMKSACNDEYIYVFCDIINKIKQLISLNYYYIDGIYDLYLMRVLYSLWSVENLEKSNQQELLLKKNFNQCCKFVPNLLKLKKLENKYLYYLCVYRHPRSSFLDNYRKAHLWYENLAHNKAFQYIRKIKNSNLTFFHHGK